MSKRIQNSRKRNELYQRQREADFAVFHEVDEALKGYDPEELQARIDQAVEEVKAKSRPSSAEATEDKPSSASTFAEATADKKATEDKLGSK